MKKTHKNALGIINFYQNMLDYLQSDVEVEGEVARLVELAKEASPSWEATEENILMLEKCKNRNKEVEDDDVWSTTLNDFAKAAFRDLSVLRNPQAVHLFRRLGDYVVPNFCGDVLVWAQSVKERPDGSGVIILHVSNVQKFRDMIEGHSLRDHSTQHTTLEECVQIGC